MNKVRIYTIDNCPYCAQLKELLTKDGIEFTEINANLVENKEEFEKLIAFVQTEDVPIVKVGQRVLIPGTSFQSINEAHELTKKFLV